MKTLFIGPQGSGKGTQAKIIAEKHGYAHISMGDLLRAEVEKNTKKGLEIKKLIDKGYMVPSQWTIDIIKERIKEKDCKKGLIFDGFPRNLEQASLLSPIIRLDAVILIKISDKESVARLTKRRQCRKCGYITSIDENKTGKCEKCGGGLYQREDDAESAIKKRLELYHRDTEPMIKQFENSGIVYRVDGHNEIKKVTKEIEKIISTL